MEYTFTSLSPDRQLSRLCLGYLAMLHGIKAVSFIKLRLPTIETDVVIRTKEEARELTEGIRKILGPLELKMTGESRAAKYEPSDLCNRLITSANDHWIDYMIPLAHMTLNQAYEYCRSMDYITHDPIWEFLRHCRNAISHNGKLNFIGSEPGRPAQWRSITLVRQLHGKKLMKKGGDGMLEAGDPVALLLDIENKFPTVV